MYDQVYIVTCFYNNSFECNLYKYVQLSGMTFVSK